MPDVMAASYCPQCLATWAEHGEAHVGLGPGGTTMKYKTPELRALGSFAGLTMGTGGSCPDGADRNINQVGGMSECGPSL